MTDNLTKFLGISPGTWCAGALLLGIVIGQFYVTPRLREKRLQTQNPDAITILKETSSGDRVFIITRENTGLGFDYWVDRGNDGIVDEKGEGFYTNGLARRFEGIQDLTGLNIKMQDIIEKEQIKGRYTDKTTTETQGDPQ